MIYQPGIKYKCYGKKCKLLKLYKFYGVTMAQIQMLEMSEFYVNSFKVPLVLLKYI